MAGRTRKMGVERYASGAIKKVTVAELEEANRTAALAARLVVMQQPHRQGDDGQLPGSALGRFVRRHRLRIEYFQAGEKYSALVRKLWAAKGVPSDVRVAGSGHGLGPTDALVKRWEVQDAAIRAALKRRSPQALEAVREVAVFDREVSADMVAHTINGLTILAIELGMTRAGSHPFL